jgi:hypothetical protein
MNRSSTQAHTANAPGLRTRFRQLLHVFAEAGQPSPAGLQLFLGPNGGLMWTDSVQVDRSEPYAGAAFPAPEKSAPVVAESPPVVRPQESAGSLVYTPLEAPLGNQASLKSHDRSESESLGPTARGVRIVTTSR